MLRFDSLICDLDGTLVDSFQDIHHALSIAAKHLGLPIPDETLIRNNMHLRLDQLVDLLYPNANKTRFMQEFRSHYDSSGYPHTLPYPGVIETLRTLNRQGCRLFVATNKRKVAADAIVARIDRERTIEDVITSDSGNPPLSKREIVQKIIIDWTLNPLRIAMIGDTQEDWKAAVENQITFIFATYGYGKLVPQDSIQSNILSINSFPQLEGHIIYGHLRG